MFPPKIEKIEIKRLMPHEEYREDHVLEVLGWFKRDGYQLRPIAVYELKDFGYPEEYVIVDGHHRTETTIRLGLRYIMANKINYFDPRIVIESWHDGLKFTKEDVIKAALNKEKLPSKATKHMFALNGSMKPFQDNDFIEPRICTYLETLK